MHVIKMNEIIQAPVEIISEKETLAEDDSDNAVANWMNYQDNSELALHSLQPDVAQRRPAYGPHPDQQRCPVPCQLPEHNG